MIHSKFFVRRSSYRKGKWKLPMCNYSPRTGTCPKHGIITLLSQTCCCSDWGLGIVQGWHQITHWGNQGRINTSSEALIYIISYFSVSFLSWVLPAYITFYLLLWYYSLFLFLEISLFSLILWKSCFKIFIYNSLCNSYSKYLRDFCYK